MYLQLKRNLMQHLVKFNTKTTFCISFFPRTHHTQSKRKNKQPNETNIRQQKGETLNFLFLRLNPKMMTKEQAVAKSVHSAVQKLHPDCSVFDTLTLSDDTTVFTLVLRDNLMGQVHVGPRSEAWARQVLAHCALHNAKHVAKLHALQPLQIPNLLPMIVFSIVKDCERFAATLDEATVVNLDDKEVWRIMAATARAVQEAHAVGWNVGTLRAKDSVAFCHTAVLMNLQRSAPAGVMVNSQQSIEDLIRTPPNTQERDEFSDLWSLGFLMVEQAVRDSVLPLADIVRVKLESVFKNGVSSVMLGNVEVTNPRVKANQPLTEAAVRAHHELFLATDGASLLSFWNFRGQPFAASKPFKLLDMCIDLCVRARRYAELVLGLPVGSKDPELVREASSRIMALLLALLEEVAGPEPKSASQARKGSKKVSKGSKKGSKKGKAEGDEEDEEESGAWVPTKKVSKGQAFAWSQGALGFVQKLVSSTDNRVVARATADLAWPFARQKPQSAPPPEFEADVRKQLARPQFAESVIEALVAGGALSAPVPREPHSVRDDPMLSNLRRVLEHNFYVGN